MVRGVPWARFLFVAAIAGIAIVVIDSAAGRGAPGWLIAAAGFALVVSVGAGVFLQGSGLFARPILAARGDAANGRVALTFDDGPDPVHTRAVLDLLERGGHRATFFVIGARAEKTPELLDELVRRGHRLANHSFAHSHATPFFSVERLVEDLTRAQALITRAGAPAPRWFRAPIGILSPRVAQAARRMGLELVGWTASARDGVARTTVDAAVARLLPALAPGAILVLHDGAERSGRAPIAPAVLARLLAALDARGLKSVTLDELLGDASAALTGERA